MRLVRFNGWATGVVVEAKTGSSILDLGAALHRFRLRDIALSAELEFYLGVAGGSWIPIIAGWERLRGPLESFIDFVSRRDPDPLLQLDFAAIRLNAPLPSLQSRIFAIGANFADHARSAATAKSEGLPPWGYSVLSDIIIGPGESVRPPVGVEKLDYEAEVAVVLQQGGRNIPSGELRLWGYTGWNDFSIRDPHFGWGPKIDRGSLTWSLQKNFDTGKACGPVMVVGEHDPENVAIGLKINNEIRQSGTTQAMVYSFGEVAAHISEYVTMLPGDMITSGTPGGTAIEAGVDGPFLKNGDVVEVEIEGAGVLRNFVQIGGV